jgi:hypothetical protein
MLTALISTDRGNNLPIHKLYAIVAQELVVSWFEGVRYGALSSYQDT